MGSIERIAVLTSHAGEDRPTRKPLPRNPTIIKVIPEQLNTLPPMRIPRATQTYFAYPGSCYTYERPAENQAERP